jgi:hypothetical protein
MLLQFTIFVLAACSLTAAIKGDDTVEIDTGNYYDLVDFGFLVRAVPSEAVFLVAAHEGRVVG